MKPSRSAQSQNGPLRKERLSESAFLQLCEGLEQPECAAECFAQLQRCCLAPTARQRPLRCFIQAMQSSSQLLLLDWLLQQSGVELETTTDRQKIFESTVLAKDLPSFLKLLSHLEDSVVTQNLLLSLWQTCAWQNNLSFLIAILEHAPCYMDVHSGGQYAVQCAILHPNLEMLEWLLTGLEQTPRKTLASASQVLTAIEEDRHTADALKKILESWNPDVQEWLFTHNELLPKIFANTKSQKLLTMPSILQLPAVMQQQLQESSQLCACLRRLRVPIDQHMQYLQSLTCRKAAVSQLNMTLPQLNQLRQSEMNTCHRKASRF